MGLFSFFKRTPKLKPQRVEKVGLKMRLKNRKHSYEASVAIVYKGKPLRQFNVTETGYSRDKVAEALKNELTLQLISVNQIKKPKQ